MHISLQISSPGQMSPLEHRSDTAFGSSHPNELRQGVALMRADGNRKEWKSIDSGNIVKKENTLHPNRGTKKNMFHFGDSSYKTEKRYLV
ncbi:hypothetical protein NPIL_216221 [Nephila pilipes]|uniref:Uncharacterized protein n=1 Tax=Nephila pilipes TaxID=299642 RepID=A0A8X6THL8_NEPPI|nr:hypothetical protein NPIL_216221 [Nephila pilipes]